MTAQLNLDTRRDVIGLSIDLDDAAATVPLVIFDAPDDLRAPAKLSLVSLEARASHRAAGWSSAGAPLDALKDEIILEPRGRAVLSIGREWLAERVALLRLQGGSSKEAAVVELPFSTILHLPKAPRASPRRLARISVSAGASRPSVALRPEKLDLDDLPARDADRIATLVVELPSDIVFEANRSLVVEASCSALPGGSLALETLDATPGDVAIRRLPSVSHAAARFQLTIERPEEMAGQRLTLALMLARQALIEVIDKLLAESDGKPAAVRIAAKVHGWGDGAAPASPDQPDRRFVLSPPAVVTIAGGGDAQKMLLAIGGTAHAVSFGGEAGSGACAPLRFEADPEAAADIVRYPGLNLAILRWPLGRSGAVEIAAESRIFGETVAEPPMRITPNIDREKGQSRQAQTLLPLRATITRLAQLVRSGRMPQDGDVSLRLSLSSQGQRVFGAEMPVSVGRAVHRMPICIDLGASAISIWAGPPRGEDQVFDMRPLPIGSWLAANVDPTHEEARTIDGEAAVLIPSHVSLDPANGLRSDHAPHTLAEPAHIGSAREAARARMAHFGRRYDVSVPGPPPVMRGRTPSRRIGGLKHALTTGRQTIPLSEPVNRYDAAAGKVSTTTLVDVAPLVADVLDELVDLYVLRLGQEDRSGDAADPAPVAPRVVVTCPSGIGGEVQARYGAALDLFAKRLDRLFPGASAFQDVALPLPEAVAAARYAAEALAPDMAAGPGEPVYLLTLDLGASTSDVAVSRVATQAGRLQKFETVSTFGLPVGGNAIDRALAGIVAPLVDQLTTGADAGWTPAFEAADLSRALGSDEMSCVNAQQWFWAALKQGKAALTESLLSAATRSGTPYRWTDEGDATFDIVLAAEGADDLWRGLCQPSRDAADGAIALSDEAVAMVAAGPDGLRRLTLRLSRAGLEGPDEGAKALARVVDVLGVQLQRMARSVVPMGAKRPKVFVAPTGRAALWPPLFEALAGEAARGRDVFPLQRPFAPAVMKKAVVAGAALLSSQSAGGPPRIEMRCPLAIAVTGAHLAEGLDGTLSTGAVAERVLYLSFDMQGRDRAFAAEEGDAPSLAARADLGARFQFVRAAPGLDPKGQMLSQLREVLGHQDPVAPLDGDVAADARAERIDRFGICEIDSRTIAGGIRRVTIAARDRDWQGVWDIDGDRVVRVR